MTSSLRSENRDPFDETCDKYREVIPTLPREKGWMTDFLFNYQGVWLTTSGLKGTMMVQTHFSALPTDILLATSPKSGTTWLKALIFAVVNRRRFNFSTHPLLTNGPHDCVPFLEAIIAQKNLINPSSSQRLLATHIPYPLLPPSVRSSGCRVVYLYRNPKDVLVSSWYYMTKLRPKELPPLSLEQAFDLFSRGVSHFGPFWDHALGYWKESLESPEKVLVLAYEDFKMEPCVHAKRLAEFLRCPFSCEEEEQGTVQEIVRLCSFENLSNLKVNKTGLQQFTPHLAVENRNFFRKGEVGDWKNHLTDEMSEHLDQITEEKFRDTGLIFHVPQKP
ncbi:Quercetin-3-sulfate 4'-sulfotransferase [Bertholletia excelsa]